jgi:hypothetical protein
MLTESDRPTVVCLNNTIHKSQELATIFEPFFTSIMCVVPEMQSESR